MKTQLIILLAALLLLSGGFVGCDSGKEKEEPVDERSFQEKLDSAPVEIAPRETLPDWLNDEIDEIEQWPYMGPTAKSLVFKGEYNRQVVYYIYNWYDSNQFSRLFYENGEDVRRTVVDWNGAGRDDFYATSKNWTVIYDRALIDTRSRSVDKLTDRYDFPIKAGTAE